ncbi:DUF1501 domain-containing protein [Hydrocarboniphaga sp.]|uniref:DUF1501 domain-containing protein n=1 Tax=Hydrocarboniphaga sp. TaxID=2033016 RepID=UPI003D0E25F9
MTILRSRRELLRDGLAAAAGLSTRRGMLGLLGGAMAGTAGAAFSDYKALVCVFLYGGNDGYNVLVPNDDERYPIYAATRGTIALSRDTLLPLQTSPAGATPGSLYGLPPSMPEIQRLFDQGRLAFIANVGTLLAPTTKADFLAKRDLPPRLFSHNDQQESWQASQPDVTRRLGWSGRLADLMSSANSNLRLPMNLSIAGNNLLQVGQTSRSYSLGAAGVLPLRSDSGPGGMERATAARALMEASRAGGLFERFGGELAERTVDLGAEIGAALSGVGELKTAFPESSLASQLKVVAKLIAARKTLSMSRQVFFVSAGSFDTHIGQPARQAALLTQVSQALGAFDAALSELGVRDSVTSFTASDFGRTLTSNGDGTDHAWGNVHWVTGGAVKGGAVYGQFPDLTLDGVDDLGEGRLIPTTSVEQYGATMLKWFGAGTVQIGTIFPHLSRFAVNDLGFLNG